jgi:hypothetical protein
MATKEFNSTNAEHIESITMEAVFRSWDGTGAAGCTMRLAKGEPEFENVKKALIMAAKDREERLAQELERREKAELARLKKKYGG